MRSRIKRSMVMILSFNLIVFDGIFSIILFNRNLVRVEAEFLMKEI